ncbi:LacI family DNA-binding transcriptional regulator [Gynuella sp.]|uniref:LacI family DNA-binding transcriptional regulator n=1 Tax=Gynuella sp. TaxID=2969146 RepID=UPI003D0E67F1
MITIRDVSKYASVSVATVSRVINGSRWVSDETRKKVLAAMKELGYQPNSFARSLATNKSQTVGMVVGDLSGPFFGEMMQSAEQVVRMADKHLIITSSHGTVESESEAIEFLLQRRVDVLILHLDAMPDDKLIELSEQLRIPVVIVNRLVPTMEEQCISIDNELGGYIATKHLLEQGHHSIACIAGPIYKSDSRSRLNGYRRALTEAGVDYKEHLIVESDYTEEGGKVAVKELQERNLSYSAIFAHNDHMAIGAMGWLKGKGVSVPNDVSIIGYDDIIMARYVEPSLTSVIIPVSEFGRQAGLMALQLSGEQQDDVVLRFKPELVIRNSTRRHGS